MMVLQTNRVLTRKRMVQFLGMTRAAMGLPDQAEECSMMNRKGLVKKGDQQRCIPSATPTFH